MKRFDPGVLGTRVIGGLIGTAGRRDDARRMFETRLARRNSTPRLDESWKEAI